MGVGTFLPMLGEGGCGVWVPSYQCQVRVGVGVGTFLPMLGEGGCGVWGVGTFLPMLGGCQMSGMGVR